MTDDDANSSYLHNGPVHVDNMSYRMACKVCKPEYKPHNASRHIQYRENLLQSIRQVL